MKLTAGIASAYYLHAKIAQTNSRLFHGAALIQNLNLRRTIIPTAASPVLKSSMTSPQPKLLQNCVQ